MEDQILEFIRQITQALGWAGIVLLMSIESACIPLPSEIIMPLAGWMLVADKGLGIEYIFLAGFLGAVGNVVGSVIAYWAGAWGGRPFLNRYGRYVLISQHDIELADRWFTQHGDRIVFFSRMLPAVRTFISFPAGVARMPMGRFMLYSFLGALPWSTGLAYGGYVLGQNWEDVREVMRPFDIPIVIAGVVFVIWFVWKRLKQPSPQE
ncbi:MAG: DedA family protein [Dehalococcoidia bacterium]|nr:DedA family protein [Dehalococcoidia bacterium]